MLALPAAVFIKKYSYKSGVLLGLGLYVVGALMFYPAMLTGEFYFSLAALWILSGGLSILETAANPYIVAMGPEETATRRLNLAHSFNPLGSIVGVVRCEDLHPVRVEYRVCGRSSGHVPGATGGNTIQ